MFGTGKVHMLPGGAGGAASAGAVAVLSPLSLDVFAVARAGSEVRGSRPTLDAASASVGGAASWSVGGVLSAPVIARAAARRDVDLRIAALLALLPLDHDVAHLGAALGESGLLDAVEAIARLESHLGGLRQRVLAALEALAPDAPPTGADSPLSAGDDVWAVLTRSNRASSVATRCGISPYMGSLALRRAAALAPGGSLRSVGRALESGFIPAAKAELITDELIDVPNALLVRDIVQAVLPVARTLGVGRLRDAIRAELACAREAESAAADDAAAVLRGVSRPQEMGLGLASMQIVGPTADVAHLWALIDQASCAAKPHAADEPIGGLRFDALVALVSRGSAARTAAEARAWPEPARRPAINVVVGLGTLLGADDQPAELEGLGLIDARTARQLAADPTGTWRRLLVDDDGRLISRSRAYRPPPTMAALILARDRTCRFPGCRRTRLDIDHIIEHDRGGPTEPANLAALCRTHHNLKTHRLWDYRIDPASGDARWVDRYGHVAIQPASRYRTHRHKRIARAIDRARAARSSLTTLGESMAPAELTAPMGSMAPGEPVALIGSTSIGSASIGSRSIGSRSIGSRSIGSTSIRLPGREDDPPPF